MRLTPQILLQAYSMGVFPMGNEWDDEIRWYSPNPRCIFDFDEFHVPKRLARTYRKNPFEMRVNHAWSDVLRQCARHEGIWITDEIVRAYTELHQLGHAHTVEAYCDGQLAGGLYGVTLGGAFFGESMFHTITDASKICLIYLVERLKSRGFVLLDSQYMTNHLSTLGAINIARDEYLRRLKRAISLDCKFA